MSTRKLRYFVAVAEELHFSRAAARLFVAQQAVSKQVRELEEALGTPLLRRNTRSVELTSAGAVFLEVAKQTLAVLDAGVESTRHAGHGAGGVLKLGFGVGAALELTAPILTEFAARYPKVHVELHEFGFDDPMAGLADGSSDAAFVRMPISVPDVEFEQLFVEPLAVAVSAHHRLAGRASVAVREVISESIVVGRSADEAWQHYWTLDEYRDGKPVQVATHTSSHTEELEVVAAGLACAVVAAAAARYTPHRGVSFVPIDDVPGSALGVAWRRGRRTVLVEQFVAVATAVRDRESDVVRAIERPFDGAGPIRNEVV